MKHLLLTNDFPPKRGGIQNYLYELWSRLDPATVTVMTTRHGDDDRGFDERQRFEVLRFRAPLLPTPAVRRLVTQEIKRSRAECVVIDPIFPLGLLGPQLGVPYVLLGHGAEITVPAVLSPLRRRMARTMAGASAIVTSGDYPKGVAEDMVRSCGHVPPSTYSIAPSMDVTYFTPALPEARSELRGRHGIKDGELVVLFVSRLVPRKGADVLIRALGELKAVPTKVRLFLVGDGRDSRRLHRLVVEAGIDATFFDAVTKSELRELYQSADIFAMVCRDRWFGLEQEGFGIVFLEAQASGLPVVVGRSGGSSDALVDGVTGLLVQEPKKVATVVPALRRLIDNPATRLAMGQEGRRWVTDEFDVDKAAKDLQDVLDSVKG